MRKGLLLTVGSWLTSAGLTLAQGTAPAINPAPKPGTAVTPAAKPVVVAPTPTPGTTHPANAHPAITHTDPACGPAGWAPCEPACEKSQRVWGSAEYLMWWFKDSPQPVPLVTSVAAANLPAGGVNPGGIRVGSLLDPFATVALGGNDINTGRRQGGRFTLGSWLDDDQRFGVEGSYFFIAPKSETRGVSTNGAAGTPLLSIPYFDVTGALTPNGLPGESARPILSPRAVFTRDFPSAIPGEAAGAFAQRLESRMQGFELNGLAGMSSIVNLQGFRLHALGGFRYLNLRESLTFTSNVNAGPLGFPDVVYATRDQFTTSNDFWGGQLGLRGEYNAQRFVVRTTAKVALGNVREQATIGGSTATNLILGPGTPLLNYAGGVFAQPSNIGTFSRDRFAVLPQADVSLGFRPTDWSHLFVGYTFLYLNNVARPGDQIDRNLNVTRIPFNTEPIGPNFVPGGAAQPAPAFRDSSFWAQGVNFGLELRY